MKHCIIDGEKVETLRDVHNVLKDDLDFGQYYGFNLNALYDRLARDIERPFTITIRNGHELIRKFGQPAIDILMLLREIEIDDLRLSQLESERLKLVME